MFFTILISSTLVSYKNSNFHKNTMIMYLE